MVVVLRVVTDVSVPEKVVAERVAAVRVVPPIVVADVVGILKTVALESVPAEKVVVAERSLRVAAPVTARVPVTVTAPLKTEEAAVMAPGNTRLTTYGTSPTTAIQVLVLALPPNITDLKVLGAVKPPLPV